MTVPKRARSTVFWMPVAKTLRVFQSMKMELDQKSVGLESAATAAAARSAKPTTQRSAMKTSTMAQTT